MSDLNVIRPGATNQGADKRALFLKLFSGEVMTTFAQEAIFERMTRVRAISGGKSAQFPHIGNVSASYHTPGAEIIGSQINHAERVLTIDGLLQASTSIANIDEAMNHYDVRAPYSTEIGRALAYTKDTTLARVIARAARTTFVLNDTRYPTFGSSGARSSELGSGNTWNDDLNHTNAGDNAAQLASMIFKCAEIMDSKNCPQAGRYCAVRPAQYYLLVQYGLSTTATNNHVNPLMNRDIGGMGNIAAAYLPMIANIGIVKSLHVPSTSVADLTTSVTGGNNYNGDFSKTVALVWQAEAVGTVQLLGVETEMDYSVRHQATLMVSKYACGHGVLRPECACEITTGSITDQNNLTPSA
jgi:hypothetical protein